MDFLSIAQNVFALAVVYARDTKQQASLQAQGNWCAGLEDGFACLLDIHPLDCLASDLSVVGAKSISRDQPIYNVSSRASNVNV